MIKKGYPGIDYFRLIAALLVVAVHTSPLSSLSATGDFIFTRIIARAAVPFFFMASGFFLISAYTYDAEKLKGFIKKTSLIYVAGIFLYIPINIYSGYFKKDDIVPNIIKDIVFDGTLYHLWYLPASIIGAAIAWYLVKRVSYTRAFLITAFLYVIGLLGDSYYGISESVTCLKGFYDLIFQVSDYTRNGLFFAPIFFVLGGYMHDKQSKPCIKRSVPGFAAAFSLMLAEALALHRFALQRHDSMYVFLVPCVYCLLGMILHFKGSRHKVLGGISMIIYIIHPLMIVVIRLFARLLHLQSLFIENSLIRYIAVCLISAVLGIVMTRILEKFGPIRERSDAAADRAYLEINLNALEHNVRAFRKVMSDNCQLMAVVKAEAYGHGMFQIATYLEQMGVSSFAVATIDEGISLRKYGISGEILVLGYTSPLRARDLRKYRLTQTLIDYDYSLALDHEGYRIKGHIKIDSGMHRLGFDIEDEERIASVFSMKNIDVRGIFTHLCSSDSLEEGDVAFTHEQINGFYRLIDRLKNKGLYIQKIHVQSSYGLLNYPELECDYVRIGIGLYGVLSSVNDKVKLKLDLKPVLSLKARVILLRQVRQGEGVGYGRAFTAGRNSVIAILPVGYADGFPRNLSCGNSYVLICGQQAPIVGKICMDQLAVDVTDIPAVKIGSIATLIGGDGEKVITAPMLADKAGTITNELLSRMGRRLKIITKE